MAYIIGCILILIALIIFGLILRKKVYDEVDRLESWKMDIMNRNVTSELSKVKNLNLSGETQEKFESWKDQWDHILTRELPDIEEYLLDAEEAADRFRISLSKKNLKTVNKTLQSVETTIEKMLTELDQLLDSEQRSRLEIENVQPKIKGLRKKLLQNRYQYGKAEIRFEVEIDELDEQIKKYFELTESGNYFEAQQLVDDVKNRLTLMEDRLNEFPAFYKKCKQEIPSQIDDLLKGIKTMKEDGYRIDHLGFEKELHNYQEKLVQCVELLEKANMDEASKEVLPIEERIEEMYQLLEKEAVAKTYVQKQIPSYRKLIDEVTREFDDTKEELELLQESYYLEQSDTELHLNLEKWISDLIKQFNQIEEDIDKEDVTFVELSEQIETTYSDLLAIQQSHADFKEQIRALRKDEIEAKEKVIHMRKQLYETNRKLQKSNIPGVPAYIWNLLDETSEKSQWVVANLEKQPLDMGEVQESLSVAEKSMDRMIEQTDLLLEQARLVELVIQYANRYRSQYPNLAAKLYESEKLFREYEYESALEEAVKALEAVEPGATKRIEESDLIHS